MEEYEILPRDSYQHTVTIHETPRVISWWFTTRRKNIDFGLFYRAFDHNGANNNQHQSYQQQSAEGPCASATPNLSSAALANGSDSVANVDAIADTGSTLQVHKSTQPEASSVGSRFNSQQGRRGSKLRDPLLVPLLPMAHVESSKGTIKGQWNAIWPGTYILYFDNSFSVSTSKLLTLVVAINEPTKPAEAIPSPVRYEGWLQKKKRKRMQGWARRWVSIRGNYLTYSLAPQGVARAKINLHNAVVSTDTQHHIIYIDGDEGFMQFKAKEMGEFHSWVDAINSVKACKDDLRREEGDTMSIKDGATAVAALPSIPLAQQPPLLPFVRGATPSTPVEIGTVVANWQEGGEDGTGSKTVQQIHSRFTIEATQALAIVSNLLMRMRAGETPPASKRTTSLADTSLRAAASGPNSTSPPNDIGKRPSLRNLRSNGDSHAAAGNSHTASSISPQPSAQPSSAAFGDSAVLQSLHSLRACIHNMTMFEGAMYHIAKDQSPPPLTHRSATAYSTARESAISSPTTQSQTPGDENDVFYDTYEVIEVEKSTSPESGGEYADSDEGRDDDGQFYSATQSPLTTSKSAVSPGIGRLQTSLRLSSLSKEQPIHDEVEDMRRARAKVDEYEESEEDEDEDDTSSVDLEEDLHNDPDFTRAMLSGSFSRLPISSIRTKQSENDETRALPERAPPLCSGSQEGTMAVKVVHRKRLPSPTVPDNSNVLSILRKNLGKDLSAIAMPITTNEPINALQLLCEEMQYAELLNRAGRAADSIDRLMYVTAFAVSGLASKSYRIGRKPFNPMLGETYECVREDLGFKFVAEKVSHHPAVMACHAHSDAFELYQDSQIKTKFWGKSMEFVPISVVHIKLGGCGDHYTYTKPSTLVRGIITGNRSVELQGEVDIINHTTGEVATISFKKGGFFGGVSTQVECRLYSAEPNGERTCVRTLWGDWTEKLYPEHDPYSPIWEANPPPADYKEYYGFDEFAMSLNEITPDIEPWLPQTDTRFRPDQRLYEEGEVERAEAVKTQLEEAQRKRRTEMRAKGEAWQPQWFEQSDENERMGLVKESSNPHGNWAYTGGYWETRAGKAFSPPVGLWSKER